jgi:DNA segregation ATPase FtsK/SpoIIIE-like protein
MDERDRLEAGYDLSDAEIDAAKRHLQNRLRDGAKGGCTSYIQRMMMIGYNQAARIMEYLEACRFVTEADAKGERKLFS